MASPPNSPLPTNQTYTQSPTLESSSEKKRQPALQRISNVWDDLRHKRHPGLEPEKLRSLYEYPEGIPQMAAFMGSDPNFLVCRSFTNLRSRLLLVKQIELADLEYQLEYMEKELEEDALKKNELRHCRSYFDVERKEKLQEIEQRLEEYDKIVMSLSTITKFPKVHKGNMTSFLNFLGNTQPLGVDDLEFATDELDFIAVATDEEYTPVETLITKLGLLTRLGKFEFFAGKKYKNRTKAADGNPSKQTDVQIYSPSRIQVLANIMGTLIAVAVLVVPIVVLNRIADNPSRSVYFMIPFIVVFSLAVLFLTKAKTHEIFGATAAYCAVLVVFIGVDRK